MDSGWLRLILVVCGGGLGAAARWGMDAAVRQLWPSITGRFPLGILMVNGLGCLFFGLVVGAAGSLDSVSTLRRLFLLTGVLGGFTTFSTFGHDTVRLLGEGNAALAALNVLASVLLGLAAVWVGMMLGRWIAA